MTIQLGNYIINKDDNFHTSEAQQFRRPEKRTLGNVE